MAIWRAVVSINHAGLGGVGVNTWHIRAGTPPVVSQTDQIEGAMSTLNEFYDEVGQLLPDTATYTWDGSVAGVGDDEGEFIETAGWSVSGDTAGGILPPSQCIVIGWKGASGDRSKNGRTFLGPCSSQSLAADGTPSASHLQAVRTAASNLVEASGGNSDWSFGVYSREEGVIRDFVQSKVRNQFASLRSRRD